MQSPAVVAGVTFGLERANVGALQSWAVTQLFGRWSPSSPRSHRNGGSEQRAPAIVACTVDRSADMHGSFSRAPASHLEEIP